MFSDDLLARATALVEAYAARGLKVATAESCTGGLVSALVTEVPGSSAVLERGFVTYSNRAKTDLLGVPSDTLANFGAVSQQTAAAMAEGALARAKVDLAVAITGIAGPGGGSSEKPVGLVHFGLAGRNVPVRTVECRFGELGRSAVRFAALSQALHLLEEAAAQVGSPV